MTMDEIETNKALCNSARISILRACPFQRVHRLAAVIVKASRPRHPPARAFLRRNENRCRATARTCFFTGRRMQYATFVESSNHQPAHRHKHRPATPARSSLNDSTAVAATAAWPVIISRTNPTTAVRSDNASPRPGGLCGDGSQKTPPTLAALLAHAHGRGLLHSMHIAHHPRRGRSLFWHPGRSLSAKTVFSRRRAACIPSQRAMLSICIATTGVFMCSRARAAKNRHSARIVQSQYRQSQRPRVQFHVGQTRRKGCSRGVVQ